MLLTTEELGLSERYNVAPSQVAPVVRMTKDGGRGLFMLRWGLIPSWAKDTKFGYKTINARAETVATQPAFRSAFKKRRCLVPVSGFYEWKTVPGSKTKQPYYISAADEEPLVFAGLWEWWRDPADESAEPIESFTIITTTPNELMGEIHNRMPVILSREDFGLWLDDANEGDEAVRGLLRTYPSELMMARKVSTLVNSPKNDSPECAQPIDG